MIRCGRHFLAFLASLAFLLTLAPSHAQAQWPPFWFDLIPSYQDGNIEYRIGFYNRAEWVDHPLSDVTIKIPMPAGTEFVDCVSVHPGVETSFDGQEVTIFAAVVHGSMQDITIRWRITDPLQNLFTTHAWISWKGEVPGDYLTSDVMLDISKKPLDWSPPFSFLNLGAVAALDGDLVSYAFYPENVGWLRMWDLRVSVLLPDGASLVSVQAPPGFTYEFDGRQAVFSTIELAQGSVAEPLRMDIVVQETSSTPIVTMAYAIWMNQGWGVGTRYPIEDGCNSGFVVAIPGIGRQIVVSDPIGDVPFPGYDLTSASLQSDGDDLRLVLFTAAPVEDLEGGTGNFSLTIDSDCRVDTGNYGAEYLAVLSYGGPVGYFNRLSEETQAWEYVGEFPISCPFNGSTVSMWIPREWLPKDLAWCWQVKSSFDTEEYQQYPRPDYLSGREAYSLGD